MMRTTSTNVSKSVKTSIALISAGVLIIFGWIFTISPATKSFSANSLQTLQGVLIAISIVGLLLGVANIVWESKHNRQYLLSIIAVVLFVLGIFAPGILFFVGMLLGGVG